MVFGGGCTVKGSYLDVVVSPSIQSGNSGIVRVGIADFSFERPQTEQVGPTSISRPPNAGEIVADATVDLLMRLGYNVIERKQLAILLREHDLTAADLVKPETGARIGRTLGIQAVILGTVNEVNTWNSGAYWGNAVSFSARMVRLDTGEVLWSLKCDRGGQEGTEFMLRVLMEEAAQKLAAKGASRQSD